MTGVAVKRRCAVPRCRSGRRAVWRSTARVGGWRREATRTRESSGSGIWTGGMPGLTAPALIPAATRGSMTAADPERRTVISRCAGGRRQTRTATTLAAWRSAGSSAGFPRRSTARCGRGSCSDAFVDGMPILIDDVQGFFVAGARPGGPHHGIGSSIVWRSSCGSSTTRFPPHLRSQCCSSSVPSTCSLIACCVPPLWSTPPPFITATRSNPSEKKTDEQL